MGCFSKNSIFIRQKGYKAVHSQETNHPKHTVKGLRGERKKEKKVAIDFSFLTAHC